MRLLVQAGHDVHVVPTPSALRFIGRPTWEAISHHPVSDELFDDVSEVRHVALGQQADLIVVAPATANTIAKLAVGIADTLLGTTVLASRAPLVLAPAMHTEMWEHPATQANITTLRERGAVIIGPDSGQLTGSDVGLGRMSEPEAIFTEVSRVLSGLGVTDTGQDGSSPALASPSERPEGDLSGLRVLISVGGTREFLDPVRFLGNSSSGKQGFALAAAARDRGAKVTVVRGSTSVPPPESVTVIDAPTSEHMLWMMREQLHRADIVLMAAAVADYRPLLFSEDKLKKSALGERFVLELKANPDILAGLVEHRAAGQTIVGFSAETDERGMLSNAYLKLVRKGCDLLVLNQVGPENGIERTFDSDTNHVYLLHPTTPFSQEPREVTGDKLSVAHAILDEIIHLRSETKSDE